MTNSSLKTFFICNTISLKIECAYKWTLLKTQIPRPHCQRTWLGNSAMAPEKCTF